MHLFDAVVGPVVDNFMMTSWIRGVRLHDSESESEIHGPTMVARSMVCCSTVAD
jgi:hypothetical protein